VEYVAEQVKVEAELFRTYDSFSVKPRPWALFANHTMRTL
jgi:hypothetical protein